MSLDLAMLISLSIKMKTNEIGCFTYFGEVGTMFGFKTKSISNDQCIRMSIADSTGSQRLQVMILSINLTLIFLKEHNQSEEL